MLSSSYNWLSCWLAQTSSLLCGNPGCVVEVIAFSSNMLGTRCCDLVRQAVTASSALSSLYRTIFSAAHVATQMPVRYVGVFTDGGADKSLRSSMGSTTCAAQIPSTFQ